MCIPLNPVLIPRSGEDIYTPLIVYPISALNNYIEEHAFLSKSKHPIAYQKQCPITALSTAHSMYLAPPVLALCITAAGVTKSLGGVCSRQFGAE